MCSRVLCVSCPTCSCVLRASCPTCSRASHTSCLRWFRTSHALCFTCFVTYVASCLGPMWPYASHFISPFSLRTLLSRTLSTLCPNITFCALEFPCFTLLFFYLFATCEFLVEFTKVKTNIVLAVILWSDNQYLLTVWFISICWNQIRKHTCEIEKYFGTGEGKFNHKKLFTLNWWDSNRPFQYIWNLKD